MDLGTDSLPLLTIVGLLPLTAALLVTQLDPYHALVLRGILGAVAALIYALLGAADVALTEALVGALLSTTLYAIATRSSLRLRLGILTVSPSATDPEDIDRTGPMVRLKQVLAKRHLRLELVPYATAAELANAIDAKTLHGIVTLDAPAPSDTTEHYHLQLRSTRLAEQLEQAISAITPNAPVALKITPLSPSPS